MIRRFPVAALLAVLLLGACESPVAPGPLAGTWLRTSTGPGDSRSEHRLTFGAGGSYVAETVRYGSLWVPSTELTERYRTSGSFRMEGNRLMLRVVRTESWARDAAGPNPHVEVERVPRWNDAGSAHLEEDRLIRITVSAPLDVPETFVQVYTRER